MLGTLERMHSGFEMRREFAHALHGVVALQQIDPGKRRRASDGVRRIGVAMRELGHIAGPWHAHEGIENFLLDDHAAHRLRAIGDLLGKVQHVGRDTEELGAGPGAAAAKACDDFIEYQQDVVRRADFAQALQVALGRDDHAGRSGKGLDDHGRDVRGVVQGDQLQQLVGQLGALLGHAAIKAAVGRLGVRQMVGLERLPVELAVAHQPADRNAAKADAVVAANAAHQARLAGQPLVAPVGARHLERGVGRLGA